jgi:hypothetical protein
MICPNCGTRIVSGLTKCHFCGYILPSEEISDIDLKKQELSLNKFIALFTIFAFAIAAAAIFNSIFGTFVCSATPEGPANLAIIWIFTILFGFIIAAVYLALTPWFIKNIIDRSVLKERRK